MPPRSRLLIILVLAVAVGALATAGALLVVAPTETVTTTGTAAIGGPFSLAAKNGENVTDQTYHDKWLLIFFGYTFCPDACPTALSNIRVALEKLGPDAGKLRPLFITVDPQRDTREVISIRESGTDRSSGSDRQRH
jgi:protein SCO1/2